MIPVPLLNPAFATEFADKSCERRVRGTDCGDVYRKATLTESLRPLKRPRYPVVI
jgi:hypothetical protein